MRIVVGMSGGVDSSVAALLLKRQGHEVIGVFMHNWEEQDEGGVCTSEQDFADMRAVCDALAIPYYSVNFAKEYRERVFAHFLAEYRRGRTPNPDVLCNREIKFDVFARFARSLGAEKMATGHFAQLGARDGRFQLLRARDEGKDQTYFLYMLDQAALAYSLFPTGNLTKREIRDLARENGIPTFDKKDSTGVCFIGERNFKAFLAQYLPAQPGEIHTVRGERVGKHDGLMYYTLGQRRGLGIGGGGDGRRWFVVEKDLARNVLIVDQGEDSPRLYSLCAQAEGASWIAGQAPFAAGASYACLARFRHRQPPEPVRLRAGEDGTLQIEFERPQRAITPGQAAVFYQGRECLGGAAIQ